MQLSFHGAARTVTGSKHLLQLENGLRILLDCGLFQGMGRDTDRLNQDFGFHATEVDLVVLSHAHIDHSGLLPKLAKEGFKGKVFCTPPTKDLAALLLADSAHIQEVDTAFANKRRKANGEPPLEPLYDQADVETILPRFETVDYDQWTGIAPGVELLFTEAGHIIGSACVHLRIAEKRMQKQVTFSGDLGRYQDAILRAPAAFPAADYLIMESTYGDKLHEHNAEAVDTLLQWIDTTCVQQNGKLIMPAFSLGRTQEILYALNQLELENRLPKVDFFLDSPLSIEITQVLKRWSQYFNPGIQEVLKRDDDPFHFRGLKWVENVEESKQLNYRNQPCVIISASGMAESGRVKHHISNAIENSRNAILMTGYCEPRSLGGKLLSGRKTVRIFGVEHEVNARIGGLKSMSAHGDANDMLRWLENQEGKQPQQIFLVHGDYDTQQLFQKKLNQEGFQNVRIPEQHEVVRLS